MFCFLFFAFFFVSIDEIVCAVESLKALFVVLFYFLFIHKIFKFVILIQHVIFMPKSDVMITLICAKSDQRNVINGKYIQQATITMNINIKEYKY